MKPNELRVGNWVTSKEWCGYHKIDGIERIDDDIFELKTKGYAHRYEQGKYFDLSPIPLTEELLLKCKFTKAGMCYVNRSVIISRHSGNTFCLQELRVCSLQEMQVRSLHQLQNIYYALTGEELEVKL